jgi:Carboxypeptidase regulatory-like domain/TonB-dependent Receptor Plug Domain
MFTHQYCCPCLVLLATTIVIAISSNPVCAQTPSTGALTGVVLDASGAVLNGAEITLTNQDTSESARLKSDTEGRFGFFLLAPGQYELCVEKADFAPLCRTQININVTETRRLELRLQLSTIVNKVQVSGDPPLVQTDDSALGRVVNETAISSLPLVTRNFAQIASLSPGVAAGVSNAGELGLGGTALSQINKSNDGIFVHGARSYDNNWQLDGISVSDVHGNGSGSGGIPIPNPDTIQEFKVQTGLYDAAYGRYAGANVTVITKSGGSEYHGAVFEFLRNDDLNANDFFLIRHGRSSSKINSALSLEGRSKKTKCSSSLRIRAHGR